MSSFCFIFFPRKLVDTGIMSSNAIFTSGELECLEQLPFKERKRLETLTYSEIRDVINIPIIKEKYLDSLSKKLFPKLFVFDDVNEKFSFVDKNEQKYVYRLENDFEKPRSEKRYEVDLKILKSKSTVNGLYLTTRLIDMVNRRLLCQLIDENICSGEHVDIYIQTIGMEDPKIWGPPDNIFEIDIEDILNNRKFFLTTRSNDMYIIYKQ